MLDPNNLSADIFKIAAEQEESGELESARSTIRSVLEHKTSQAVCEGLVYLCLRLKEPSLGIRLIDQHLSSNDQQILLLHASCHAAQSNWKLAVDSQILALDSPFLNKEEEYCEILRLAIYYHEAGEESESEKTKLRLSPEQLPLAHTILSFAQEALTQYRYAESAGYASHVLAFHSDPMNAADILGQALQHLNRPFELLGSAALYNSSSESFAARVLSWVKVLDKNGQRDQSCLILRAALKQKWSDQRTRELQKEFKRLYPRSQTASCLYESSDALLVIDGTLEEGDTQSWLALYTSFFKGRISIEELPNLPDEQILIMIGSGETNRYNEHLACIDTLSPGHAAAVSWGGTVAIRARDLRDILSVSPNIAVEAASILPILTRVARFSWSDPIEAAPIFEPLSVGLIWHWHWFSEPLPEAVFELRQAGIEFCLQDLSICPTDIVRMCRLRLAIWLEAPKVILVKDEWRGLAEEAVIGLRVAVLSISECQDKSPSELFRMIGAKLEPVAIALGSGIGNIIVGTPMVRRLAETLGRPVDVILDPDYPECDLIFQDVPWVHQVFKNITETDKKPFDIVLVTPLLNDKRPKFSSSRTIWGRDHGYVHQMKSNHEASVNLRMLQDHLKIPFTDTDSRRQFFGDFRHQPSRQKRIGLHAGSKPGRWMVKRWPYYEDLSKWLVQRGFEVICVGSTDEVIQSAENHTGLSLKETIKVIASCDAFIANDSGLMHAADAMGVPLLAIFAPTSTIKNGPLSSHSRIVRLVQDCAPCQFDSKTFLTCNCIQKITIDEVKRAFDELWAVIQSASAPALTSTVQVQPPSPKQPTLTVSEFEKERARALSLLESPKELLSLSAHEISHLLWRAPLLGVAQHVAQIHAQTRSNLLRRYPVFILRYIETAAFVLNSHELEDLAGFCLNDAIEARSHTAVRDVLMFLLTYCGNTAAKRGLHKLALVLPHHVSGVPALRQITSSAQEFGIFSDVNLPLEKLIQYNLRAGNRYAFIATVNAWLSCWRSADHLALQLKSHTDLLASFSLSPQDIWQDTERSALLDVLLFSEGFDIPPENLEASVMWSAARQDHIPLNHFLNARIADLQPVQLSGTDLRALFESVLAITVSPACASFGKVTVILAAYAPDPTLLDLAIRSNLLQSYEDLEVLLIDDCSPLPIEQILSKELLHHPKLRIHRLSQNSGPYVCRNIGLSLSTGPWVAFHDADDVSHPQRIEYQIGVMAANPKLRVSYVGHIRFDTNARIEPAFDGTIIGDGPVTSIFRREVLEEVGPFSPVLSRGDVEMRARMVSAYGTNAVLKLNTPLLFCSGGNINLSSRAISTLLGPIQLFRRAFNLRLVLDQYSLAEIGSKLGPLTIPPDLQPTISSGLTTVDSISMKIRESH